MNNTIAYSTPIKNSANQIQTQYKPFKRQQRIQRTSSKDSVLSSSSKKSQKLIDTGGYIKFKPQSKHIQTKNNQKTNYQRITTRATQNGHRKSTSFLTNLNYATTMHSQIPQPKPHVMKKTDPNMRRDFEPNQNNGKGVNFTSKNYYTPRLRTTSNIDCIQEKPQISFRFEDIQFSDLNQSSIIQDSQKNGQNVQNQESLRNDYFFSQQIGNAFNQIDSKFTQQLQNNLQIKSEEIKKLKVQNSQLAVQIEMLKIQNEQRLLTIQFKVIEMNEALNQKDSKIFDLQNKLKSGQAQGSNKLMLQQKRIFDLLKKNKQFQDQMSRKNYNIQILNDRLKSAQDCEMELRQKIVKIEYSLSESRTQRYDSQKSQNCSSYLQSTQDYSLRPCEQLQFYRTQLDYVTNELQKKQQAYCLMKTMLYQTQTKLTTVNAKMKYQKKKIQFQAQNKYNNLLSNYRQAQKDLSHLKRITRNQELQLQLSP